MRVSKKPKSPRTAKVKRRLLRMLKSQRGAVNELAAFIGIAPRNLSRFLHTPCLCDSENMLGILVWMKQNKPK